MILSRAASERLMSKDQKMKRTVSSPWIIIYPVILRRRPRHSISTARLCARLRLLRPFPPFLTLIVLNLLLEFLLHLLPSLLFPLLFTSFCDPNSFPFISVNSSVTMASRGLPRTALRCARLAAPRSSVLSAALPRPALAKAAAAAVQQGSVAANPEQVRC